MLAHPQMNQVPARKGAVPTPHPLSGTVAAGTLLLASWARQMTLLLLATQGLPSDLWRISTSTPPAHMAHAPCAPSAKTGASTSSRGALLCPEHGMSFGAMPRHPSAALASNLHHTGSLQSSCTKSASLPRVCMGKVTLTEKLEQANSLG